MASNKEAATLIDEVAGKRESSLTYDDRVIKKIAGIAASEVDGILSIRGGFMSGLTDLFKSSEDMTKGISAEVGKKQVALDMKVICEYGRNIPEIFSVLVEKITRVMKDMTGLDVVEVNVHVDDVMTLEEFEQPQKASSGDRKGDKARVE